MIDVSDFEEMEDVAETTDDTLAWSGDFLSGKYSALNLKLREILKEEPLDIQAIRKLA